MVGVATLTGAAKVAWGRRSPGYGGHPWLVDAIIAAATTAGESVADAAPPRVPRLDRFRLADMKNTGGRFGGAIFAALLLSSSSGAPMGPHRHRRAARWPDDEQATNARAPPDSGCGLWLLSARRWSYRERLRGNPGATAHEPA